MSAALLSNDSLGQSETTTEEVEENNTKTARNAIDTFNTGYESKVSEFLSPDISIMNHKPTLLEVSSLDLMSL